MKEERKVLVYYCECGKSIQCAGDPEYINKDRQSKNEFAKMAIAGRKIETLTMEQYKKTPFMCLGTRECPKNDTSNTRI